MTEWLLLLLALGLVLACGGFVAAEFALVTVDRASVDRSATEGDARSRGVQSAMRTLSTQLSGAQLGITITNLAIGFLAEPAIAVLVDGPLEAAGVPPSAVPGVSIALGLTLATGLTMVFGELVPKNLALANPLGTARATQAYQRGFTKLMQYPINVLNGSANGVVRALGVEPQEELRSARNATELTSLVRRSASEGTLDPGTADLMERALTFGGRTAGVIMTPRARMATAEASDPVQTVLEMARSTGRSRFPVIDGDFDSVVGAVHVKHAVAVPRNERGTARVSEVMITATLTPDSVGIDALLMRLRDEGLQMAVVVDEYGGTAGLVTLEDVVEELVGEISDEHDNSGFDLLRKPDGSWALSGLLRPDEVQHLTDVHLPESDDYDTVAGLVLDRLGRIPEVGDSVSLELPPAPSHTDDEAPEPLVAVLTVERMETRRVARVRLTVRGQEAVADE